MLHQAVCGTEGAISKHCHNVRCIASDEETDHLKVIENLERPTLLEPSRHPLAGLFLTDQLATVGLTKASLNLVEQVQPVDSVLDAGVFRQFFHGLQDFLLGFHNLPSDESFGCIVAYALCGTNLARSPWVYNASGELLGKSAAFFPVSSTALLGREALFDLGVV